MQNEYLERNLADVENRHEFEASRYQVKLAALAAELENATAEMKLHLAEYKRLMSVKNSLVREIKTYRKLLEGDDSKLVFSNCCCCIVYLFSRHRTASDTKYCMIRTLFIAMSTSCLEESAPV